MIKSQMIKLTPAIFRDFERGTGAMNGAQVKALGANYNQKGWKYPLLGKLISQEKYDEIMQLRSSKTIDKTPFLKGLF